MKTRLGLLVTAGLAVAVFYLHGPESAAAHPLGNFTVNRYLRLELSSQGLNLRYVVDMAEIPAFTEIKVIDANRDGSPDELEAAAYAQKKAAELIRGVDVRLGGRRVSFPRPTAEVTFPEGQGGLKTLRLVADAQAPLPDSRQAGSQATVHDLNFADRLGWREIVVRAGDGVRLLETTASAIDQTAELTSYPSDRLKSPADVRQASFRFEASPTSPASAPTAATRSTGSPAGTGDRFAGLVLERKLTPAFVALSLLLAAAWGAAHALGPGHGKTIVAAYLVGSRATMKHALILGLTVTATHTSSVIVLGLATLYAAHFVRTDQLYLWLSVVSGLFVVALGLVLFVSRLRRAREEHDSLRRAHHSHASHVYSHDHHVDHSHQAHNHSHAPAAPGLRGLLALGISGGLLPCPSALVVVLGATALDRTAYGLVLVVAFSVGLASVLMALGLALVFARRLFSGRDLVGRFDRFRAAERLLRLAPVVSSLAILAVGFVLTTRALAQL